MTYSVDRFSLMIIRTEEVNANFIKFIIYGDRTGQIRHHFIPNKTHFQYHKFEVDSWYLISSQNVDSVWMWRMAWPLDMNNKFF
jgi:hypothetical protein